MGRIGFIPNSIDGEGVSAAMSDTNTIPLQTIQRTTRRSIFIEYPPEAFLKRGLRLTWYPETEDKMDNWPFGASSRATIWSLARQRRHAVVSPPDQHALTPVVRPSPGGWSTQKFAVANGSISV